MISFKTQIQHYFDKASSTYENVAYIQKQSAEFLVRKLLQVNRTCPQTILDLGTGTGYVPEFLMQYYPNASYILNDIAPEMLAISRLKFAKHKNFIFSIGDIENIDFANYHLIISNLALQWVDDLWKILQKCQQKSDIFAFSCLLNGTFQEWQNILSSYDMTFVIKEYPQEQELVAYCNQISNVNNQCYLGSQDFCITFQNPLAFMKYLKNLGAGIGVKNLPLSVLKSLIERHSNVFTITYKIFFGILKR